MISDKEFLGFKWPSKMSSFSFKRRRKYIHEVIIISNSRPEIEDLLIYSSEPKAKKAEKALGEAINNISVIYNKREVPVTVEEGFIE